MFILISISLVIGLLIGYYLKYLMTKKEVRSLEEQLDTFHQNPEQLPHLTMRIVDSELTPVVNQFNRLLQQQHAFQLEQKHREQQLRHNLENISHDLRTPLTAIHGYLELLQEDTLSQEKREHYLTIAIDRTMVLNQLIQNLFYLSKLENHAIHFKPKHFDVSQTLITQLSHYYQAFTTKKLEMHVDITPNSMILSDPQGAERLISNLLRNIIEHGYGEVTIRHEQNAHGKWVTTFKNQTDYHDTFDIERVFDRHFMGDNTRHQENSGLGLTIVREIATQLHHDVVATSGDDWFCLIVTW